MKSLIASKTGIATSAVLLLTEATHKVGRGEWFPFWRKKE